MKIQWTESQQQAIQQADKDMLVSASAGSGKTTVMIERIARMLADGTATMDGILVLTFTKASATDMRIKLRKKLESTLGRGDWQSPVVTKLLEELPTAQIGTFHKFCNDLVQTYFNVACLDPGVDVLSDTDAHELQTQILDELLPRMYAQCTLAIDTFCAGRKTDDLKALILDIYNFLGSREDADTWLDEIALVSYREEKCRGERCSPVNPSVAKILAHYREMGEYYTARFNELHVEEKHAGFVKTCLDAATRLACVKSIDCLRSFRVDWEARNTCKPLQKLRDELKKEIKKLTDITLNAPHDKQIVEQTIMLVREFMRAFSAEKQRIGKIDFGDMERHALKILSDPAIVAQLRDKYKHIFIDEYQDTNPVQERIMNMLMGQTFSVGDVKQSIYGFRGSEVSIITDKMSGKKNSVVLLNQNFRSNPEILHFVDKVFSQIMTPAVGIDYEKTGKFNAKNFEYKNAVDITIVDTGVEREKCESPIGIYDLLNDTAQSDETKKVMAQCVVVADKIVKLRAENKNLRLSDIAILARSKTHVSTLTRVLSYAGIESHTVDKTDVGDLFEIAILENFLYAISNHHNDMPLVLSMSSLPFNFTSQELATIAGQSGKTFYEKLQSVGASGARPKEFLSTLDKYHEFSKNHTVVETLDKFIAEFHIIESLLAIPNGEVMVSNIHRFLNKLRGASFGAGLGRYLYLRENGLLKLELDSGGSTTDRVQIMTIHKSKGLEFPAVILFDAGANFSAVDTRKFMVIDRECGLCVHSTDVESYSKSNSVARMGALISGKRVQVAEEMRLLYVALTRAKEKLVIVGAMNCEKIDVKQSDYEVLQSKNYLDFVSPILTTHAKIIPIDKIKAEMKPPPSVVLDMELAKPEVVAALRDTYRRSQTPIIGADTVLKNSVTSLTRMETETMDFVPQEMLAKPVDRGNQSGIEYGTQFHAEMQNIDWEGGTSIDPNINKCLEVLRPFLAGMKIQREVAFLQTLSVGASGARPMSTETPIIVQGVIDLLATSRDRVVMIDYKTTKVGEQKLLELYRPQMQMYAAAIGQALGRPVEVYIYSTHLKTTLSVPT